MGVIPMSNDEELREKIQRATGQAYGSGTDPNEIVAILNTQMQRWDTVAEEERKRRDELS